MRKTMLAFAALAALGLTVTVAAPAVAQDRVVITSGDRHDGVRSNRNHRKVVVIKRRHDNGLHRGWSNRAHAKKVVIVKRRDHDRRSVVIQRN